MKLKKSLFAVAIVASVPLLGLAADSPKKGEITMERAKEIAMKNVKGTIKSSEYEFEKGQNVYSFDIDGSDGKLHEVLVSAKHGKIVSSTIETAAKEAAEQKADEKAH
jgi:hypothetical protein